MRHLQTLVLQQDDNFFIIRQEPLEKYCVSQYLIYAECKYEACPVPGNRVHMRADMVHERSLLSLITSAEVTVRSRAWQGDCKLYVKTIMQISLK